MKKRLCAVRIGVDHYLLSEAQAMRVFGALRGAPRIERDWSDRTARKWLCKAHEPLDDIEMIAVAENDIHLAPKASSPLLIEDRR